jgi:hypothetical protein
MMKTNSELLYDNAHAPKRCGFYRVPDKSFLYILIIISAFQFIVIGAISNYFLPVPKVLKEKVYLLYWDLLCFWQEKEDEAAQYEGNQGSK